MKLLDIVSITLDVTVILRICAQVGMGCIVSGFFVPTMFPGFLGFSAPVSVTPALVVIAVPATVVEYIAPAPAVSYAAPESLFGRLRDQSKLTIRLLCER